LLHNGILGFKLGPLGLRLADFHRSRTVRTNFPDKVDNPEAAARNCFDHAVGLDDFERLKSWAGAHLVVLKKPDRRPGYGSIAAFCFFEVASLIAEHAANN
jgi:hypothetical protein